MKQKLFLCLICLMALFGQSSWADNSLSDMPEVQLSFRNDQACLQGGIRYYVAEGKTVTITNNKTCPIEIQNTHTGKGPAVIYLKKGATLKVQCTAVGQPAIHLGLGQQLVIAGDKGSQLIAIGGRAEAGGNGSNGKDDYDIHESVGSTWGGKGGNGGYGGRGGAPGIGGTNTGRAEAGAGGEKAELPHNQPTNPGPNCVGKGGKAGHVGETMGTLYIMGDVKVTATKGSGVPATTKVYAGKNSITKASSNFCSTVKVSGSGGGGAGGNGSAAVYDIGGGGCSGAGGGGGGAGGMDGTNRCSIWKKDLGEALGGGGVGGINGNGIGVQPHGTPLAPGTFTREGTKVTGASGGTGGTTVKQSDNGQTFATPNVTISGSVKEKKELNPSTNPLKTQLYFYKNGVTTTTFPVESTPFYFGMPMADSLGNSLPKATNPNLKFKGFYLDNAFDKMVYDEYGRLNKKDYSNLLYSFKHVKLGALWEGHTTVTRRLMLQNADDDGYSFFNSDTKELTLKEETQTLDISRFDDSETPAGFHFSSSDQATKKITVKVGDNVSVDFKYDRNIHKITYVNNNPKEVNLHDNSGKVVPSFSENLRTLQYVKEPMTSFSTPEDTLGYSRSWTGYVDGLMPDEDVTATLSVKANKFAVFAKKVDNGYIKGFTTDKPDSVAYKTSHEWTLRPNTGCYVSKVDVYRFNFDNDEMSEQTINGYKMKNDSVFVIESMPASDIIIVPEFKKYDYSASVKYVDELGKAVGGMEATFKTEKGGHLSDLAANPAVTYNYGDKVVMYAQKKDNPDAYVVVPEVTDAKGNKIETTYCFINLNKMDEAEIIEEIESAASTDDAELVNVNIEGVVLGYYYTAPASNTTVTFTVTKRQKGTCTFFNETTNSVIDSVFVNMERKAGPLNPNESVTAGFRAYNIIGFVSPVTNIAAVKAGYWDEQDAYHELEFNSSKFDAGGGRYKNFYFTIAPKAERMTMGITEGLRIYAAGISPLTQWHCANSALEHQNVEYAVTPTTNGAVILDSVVVRDINNKTIYNLKEEYGTFEMPGYNVFVYTYAHENNNIYKVSFLNNNGDTLYVQEALYNTPTEYRGNVPTTPSSTVSIRYGFRGWEPALEPVITTDATYRATYDTYIRADENSDNDLILGLADGQQLGVDLVRQYHITKGKYNSICLPFALTREGIDSIFGKGTVVGAYTSSAKKDDNTYTLNFSATDAIMAGIPYLISPTKEIKDTIRIKNVKIENTLKDVEQMYATYKGCFNRTYMKDGDTSILYVIDDKLYYPDKCTGPLRSLRGYFTLSGVLDAKENIIQLVATGNEGNTEILPFNKEAFDPGTEEIQEATSIQQVKEAAKSGGTRKVLYHGSIYILKDGQVYDSLGNRREW